MSNNKKTALSVVIISFIILIICSVFFVIANNITFTTGAYFNDGKNEMLIVDNESIILNDADKTIPKSTKIGNTLLVVHNGIMESYPPQVNVKIAFILRDDVNRDVVYPINKDTIFRNETVDKEDAAEWFAE